VICPNSEIAVRQTASTKNDALFKSHGHAKCSLQENVFFALRTRYFW
jgi:hypothetical protein